MPGFGFSDAPDRKRFRYTFENLSKTIGDFTLAIGLNRYAICVFDYGAPVGFRLALADPDRITAIISQNGNAYEEGLSQGWNPIQKYWTDPTPANRTALRDFLTPESTRWQYLHGVPDEKLVAPESYALDSALLERPNNDEIQLDLFLDYASNVGLYPKFQEYFRTKKPSLLAVWGRTIRSSFRRAQKRSSEITRSLKFISSTRGILPWRHTLRKLPLRFAIFLVANCPKWSPLNRMSLKRAGRHGPTTQLNFKVRSAKAPKLFLN